MIKELKDKYFPVLDYGFVAVKDFMGDETSIDRAARVSYQGGARKVSDTRALLRYMLSHAHTSPFEQCEIVLHVGLPIFVARQWIR